MEYLGPLLELARTGSPFFAGGAFVAVGAIALIREIRRHHAVEVGLWNERYAELRARFDKLEERNEANVTARLQCEREFSEFIRTTRQVVREVGGS